MATKEQMWQEMELNVLVALIEWHQLFDIAEDVAVVACGDEDDLQPLLSFDAGGDGDDGDEMAKA